MVCIPVTNLSLSPNHLSMMVLALILMNVAPHSLAMALAVSVFPVQ